ncbi:MAG: hypothetical protein ACD_21C00196G0007 [uncultured bacterium]|nr:MAG: hypothetical protein ACD_21C00196G0007 [uncultured bacterium]
MKLFISIILLVLCSASLADSANSPNQCSKFNSIALQLALAQTGMQSPLNLDQLQNALGRGEMRPATVTTTYTWTNKNRILLVKAINDDLTTKLLTGNDDGSMISKKMERIYEKLKTATSVWIIKEIQSQLGSGLVTRDKLQNYSWQCGVGSLEVAADQNNNLIAATIGYRTHQNKEAIETQLGFNHPAWDIQTDVLGESYRAWKRTF